MVTPQDRPGAAGTARQAAIAFAVGLLGGALFWLLHTPSPAPPWLALTGLLGMVLGERGGLLLRHRLSSRMAPPTGPSSAPTSSKHGPAPH